MISLGYLFEGKVTEHLKRNWGKYAIGAGVTALAEPEVSYRYHKNMVKGLSNDIQSDSTNLEEKLRKGGKLFHHLNKAEDANARNLIIKRDRLWTEAPEKTQNKITV
jgi:hypothetical protein